MVTLTDIVPDRHATLLFEWRHRPDIARFMYSQEPIAWAGHQRWLASLPDDESRRHWMIEYKGRPVGTAYLTEIDRAHGRAMFGMYVADEGARMLGVGAAAEFLALEQAFGVLGLQKVSCEVFAANIAPRRMHARMGFQPEGVFRRHAHCDGQWTDVHRLSLLMEEWYAERSVLHQALRKHLGEPRRHCPFMNIRIIIEKLFTEILAEAGAPVPARFADDLVLLQSGLDSLGFAILITRLETECGYDPFTLMTEPFYPRTFGELVEVYDRFKAHAA